jgi:hypothetical protein
LPSRCPSDSDSLVSWALPGKQGSGTTCPTCLFLPGVLRCRSRSVFAQEATLATPAPASPGQASAQPAQCETQAAVPSDASTPAPAAAPAGEATKSAADFQKVIDDRTQGLDGQNSAINVRTREAAKQVRRKIRDLGKLAADKHAPICRSTQCPVASSPVHLLSRSFCAVHLSRHCDARAALSLGGTLIFLGRLPRPALNTATKSGARVSRSKDASTLVATMHNAAIDALNAQVKAGKQAADMETARDAGISLLTAKDGELARVRALSAKLQDLCRELQKQNKQVRRGDSLRCRHLPQL